ncbi:MAG: hypothetical protein JEZ04_10865 [Spirochaetales bacterium]|nr:hypothetical protein [Spirochaetales bacterium]
MNAYKFDVRIGNDGVINLPHLLNLINQDAEVIVVPKDKTSSYTKEKKAYKFVEKWSGFLPNVKNAPSRIDFISDKYK